MNFGRFAERHLGQYFAVAVADALTVFFEKVCQPLELR
jgi:hypothetical protein